MLRNPRFDAPVDLEGNIRLLREDACCRGFYFNGTLDRVREVHPTLDLPARAGVAARRYVPFLMYPYADFIRLVHAAATALHPTVAASEAVRRLGRTVYQVLLASHAGRVLFGVLGNDPAQIIRTGPTGYRMGLSFGKVSAERVADDHFIYHYDAFPALIETYQIGVVEGALIHCGLRPVVKIDLRDLANADLDITWR